MRKVVWFPLIVLTAAFIYAQNDSGEAPVLSKTRQNEVIAWDRYASPEELREFLAREINFVEPVGWSRNGIFAYRRKWFNSAMPGSGYLLCIFDAINDEVIESSQILTEANWQTYPGEKEIAETRKTWNALLAKYGISGKIENPFGEISTGVYETFEGKDFSCWFDYEIYGSGWDEETEWRLIAEKDGKQKTISADRRTSYENSGKKIIGYYQSPYENRILIEVFNVVRGFENETNFTRSFYGCSMDVGFR